MTLRFFPLWGAAALMLSLLCGPAAAENSGDGGAPSGGAVSAENSAPGGAAALPRYWKAGEAFSERGGSGVEGRAALTMPFRPDERLCKARYGSDWHAVCGRSAGLAGRPARGVVLTPPLPGVWRWQGDMSLRFQPDGAWPAGVEYKVSVPDAILPPGVELDAQPSFRTRPLTADIGASFLFDPQDAKKMAVSGEIRFNYPMDRAGVERLLRIAAPAAPDGERVLLGKPLLDWNADADVLSFSVPVLSQPRGPAGVSVTLKPGYSAQSGGEAGLGAELVTFLPGREGLFTLNGVEAVVATGSDLRARQTLTLDFSLPVTAAEARGGVTALLLPRQRVENGEADRPPYRWWSLEEVNGEILGRSEAVPLTLPEAADVASTLVNLPFGRELEPGRALLVSVAEGLRSADGSRLAREVRFLAQVPDFPEALRIMQRGSVLALTGQTALSLYSRNLDLIRYEAAQVRPEFINHLISRWGGFEDPWQRGLDMDVVSVVNRGELPLVRRDAETPQFSALDLGPFLSDGRKGLFLLRLFGERDGETVGDDKRFVLVTDLGLIRKRFADGSGRVYVASLSAGKPVAGAEVRVLGANGLPVFEGRSDADGQVDLPDLDGLIREKKPVAVTASLGDDLAFLPFSDYGREVDYSRFDVGGNRGVYGGIDAYLFGERDLYRPGETVHFGYIVKQGSWDADALKGLPLRAVVTDPQGREFASAVLSLPASGFGDMAWPLPETAAAGPYRLDLMLDAGDHKGGVLGSAEFRVEEFQPDTLRLSVSLDPAPARGWLRPEDVLEERPQGVEARVHLANLFGAPASGHRVRAAASVEPASFRFREYPDYTFYNAAPAARPLREELPEGVTDDNGDFVFSLPPSLYREATVRLNAGIEGFEAGGGRGVKAEASVLLSPLDMVLGWRTGSHLGYLRRNGKADVDLLAVGPDLEPRELEDVTLETVTVTYVKSLIRDERGQYRYDNIPQEKVTASRRAKLPAAGLTVPLDLSAPGDRVLAVRDGEGRLLARIPYVVAGEAAVDFDADRAPVLVARLNKQDYEPGDEVEVFLSMPYKGAGLITVERDAVAARTWFAAEAGDTVQRVRLPRDFEGRAFLNVTCFRALDDPDIFTRPLATAVVPFTVNMDGRDLHLKLDPAPASGPAVSAASGLSAELPVVRPGASFPVRVTADRPARAVIFAVDEGILQMTSYRTPDPLRALLLDRALEVDTMQYFDLLMPEYGLMRQALSAFGGGEEAAFAARGLNPFRRPGERSAVFWSGLIDVGPEAVTVDVPVPASFSGRLRVMGVACGDGAVSSAARADVLVQAEVVIQPQMPVFAAPGDEFEATVVLTDMSGRAKGGAGRAVRLTARVEGGLELVSAPAEPLILHEAEERSVTLRFRALAQPGGATVTFVAEPLPGEPGETVSRPATLSVRPATPRATDLAVGRTAGAAGAVVPFTRRLYPQFASLSASLSPLPLPVAHGLMAYLDNYPYGCTEQLLSAGFPALVLLRSPELAPRGPAYTAEALRERVTDTLAMLVARYAGDGEFSTWSAGYAGDRFLSVYAADFMTTAAEAGVAVPYNLRASLLRFLEQSAAETPLDPDEARLNAYAAWVLTRNGILTSNILATLTAWLDTYQPGWHTDLTAVFMAGCHQLMMQRQEAARLIAGYEPDPSSVWTQGGRMDGLASRSLYLSVLAAQFPDLLSSDKAQAMLADILAVAAERRYVTVSAAQAARALMVYSRGLAPDLSGAAITALDAEGRTLELALTEGDRMRSVSLESGADGDAALPWPAALAFRSPVPAYWQVESAGFDREPPARPLDQGMAVALELRRPDGSPAVDIHAGDELVLVVRARAYGGPVDSVAITALLPGGLEMILAEGGGVVDADLEGGGDEAGSLASDRPMSLDYVERRDDRLLLFPRLDTEDAVYRCRVRAAARGVFVLPPVYAEAMYDPLVRAHSAVGTLTVE